MNLLDAFSLGEMLLYQGFDTSAPAEPQRTSRTAAPEALHHEGREAHEGEDLQLIPSPLGLLHALRGRAVTIFRTPGPSSPFRWLIPQQERT